MLEEISELAVERQFPLTQPPIYPFIKHLDVTGRVVTRYRAATGGYSDVSLGTLQTERGEIEVAIKELRVRDHIASSMPKEERLRRRFFREILVWSKLSHPNVVPILGFAIAPDSLPTFVSPWFTNGNVVQYLDSGERADRMQLILDVARGLEYLHSLQLVHGDIKGDNILVDKNGKASLCDFGMATFINDAVGITGLTTTTMAAGGTARFMSPEGIQMGIKSKAGDIWSLGCAAIQVVANKTPYDKLLNLQAAVAIVGGDPPLSADYQAPTEAEQFLLITVRGCWNKDSVQRPDIGEVVAAIERAKSMEVAQKEANDPLSIFDRKRIAARFVVNLHDQIISDYQVSTWDIANWSSLGRREMGPQFSCGGYNWCLLLYPFGNSESTDLLDWVSIYLDCRGPSEPTEGWEVSAHFAIAMSSPEDPTVLFIDLSHYRFTPSQRDWGFLRFSRRPFLNAFGENPFHRHPCPIIDDDKTRITAYVQVVTRRSAL